MFVLYLWPILYPQSLSEDDRSKRLKFNLKCAAASTAVLLNNALVEGRNISVELLDDGSASVKSGGNNPTPHTRIIIIIMNQISVNSKGSQVLFRIDFPSQKCRISSLLGYQRPQRQVRHHWQA